MRRFRLSLLVAAGLGGALLLRAAGGASGVGTPPRRAIAVTVDDLPVVREAEGLDGARRTTDALLAALAAHRARACREGDSALAARLVAAYLDQTLAATLFAEALSLELFGREVPQVLLIHANELNAEALPALLGTLAARDYRFVPLEEALADPAWRTPDGYVGRSGPSWLHRFALSLGAPSRTAEEPDPPRWVLDLWRRRRGAG